MAEAVLPRSRPIALMVGQDRQETPLRHIARGLRDAGWEVDLLDSDNSFTRGRSPLAKAMSRLTGVAHARIVSAEIARRAIASGADLVFFAKTIPLRDDALAQIRARGTKVLLWYPDVSFAHPGVPEDFLDRIDLFVTTKSYQCAPVRERRSDLPSALVHHGYCEDVHYPSRGGEPAFDVVYVGNASPAKVAAIEALHRARPGLRLAVSGAGWPRGASWAQFPQLVGERMSRLLGAGKIALALHYGRHGPEGWEDAVSARTFEIPACGTFMLHPDNAEVRTLYEPGSEIGVFADHAGMIAAVDEWLADDARRERAASKALARARPAYGYRQRGREIAAFLADNGLGAAP